MNRNSAALDYGRPSYPSTPTPTPTTKPRRTFAREPRKLTRQGVPDLNGPRMNGASYNGARSSSCPHFRDPQRVAQHVVELADVDEMGYPKTTRYSHCSHCSMRLGPAE